MRIPKRNISIRKKKKWLKWAIATKERRMRVARGFLKQHMVIEASVWSGDYIFTVHRYGNVLSVKASTKKKVENEVA